MKIELTRRFRIALSLMLVFFGLLASLSSVFAPALAAAEDVTVNTQHIYPETQTSQVTNRAAGTQINPRDWQQPEHGGESFVMSKFLVERAPVAPQPTLLSYTVEYYVDSFDVENLLGSVEMPEVAIGTVVVLTQDELDAFKPPEGYAGGVQEGGSTAITADGQIIRVLYTSNTYYLVVFVANGGVPVPPFQSIAKNQTATQPVNPVRSNYTFGGWFLEWDLSGTQWNFDVDKVTGNTILYAKFTKDIQYNNVSFDTNGGMPTPSTQTIENGAKAIKPADPDKAGYSFGGWYANQDLSGSAWNFGVDTVASDMTLYAKWDSLQPTKASYSIQYYADNTNAGNMIAGVSMPEVDIGTVITLTQSQLNAYRPGNYYGGMQIGGPVAVTADGQIIQVLYMPLPLRSVTVNHYAETGFDAGSYSLAKTTSLQAYEGDIIVSSSQVDYIGASYSFAFSNPTQLTVSGGSNTINLYYKQTQQTYSVNRSSAAIRSQPFGVWETVLTWERGQSDVTIAFEAGYEYRITYLYEIENSGGGTVTPPEVSPTPPDESPALPEESPEPPEESPTPPPELSPEPSEEPEAPVSPPVNEIPPPSPPATGGTVELNDEGVYELIDDDGVPLGQFTLSEDGKTWIYEPYESPKKLPQTGSSHFVYLPSALVLISLPLLALSRYLRRRGH